MIYNKNYFMKGKLMTEVQFWIAEFAHEGIVVAVLAVIGIALWKINQNKDNWLSDWFKR